MDLSALIAEALECAESEPSDRPRHPPTLAEARRAITTIRKIIDRAEARLAELEQKGTP